jgi:hypothetical protein
MDGKTHIPEAPASGSAQGISAELRGETMAYAVQHGIQSLLANFYEPYVNYLVQKQYAKGTHAGHGNYAQNFAGEIAGDLTGAATLILAESLAPKQLHACTRTMRSWVDPLYESVAHRVLAEHAGEPDYAQQVQSWKTFQERNLVRSAIMMTTGIAGNIAMQKALGNPSPMKLIFAGKLASSALTTGLGLATRMLFPAQTKQLDSWMSKRIFAPLLGDAKPGESHAAQLEQTRPQQPAPAL